MDIMHGRGCLFVCIAAMRQDEKWGGSKHDDEHSPSDWRDIIYVHVRRAQSSKRDVGNPIETFVMQMTRVAALAMAAIQAYERTACRNVPKVKRA